MLLLGFKLREEEVRHLVDAYDPMGRGELHLEQVLEELKDRV